MRCAALHEMNPGLGEAQLTVDGEVHVAGIVVLLPVVLPPAHRAKLKSLRSCKSPIPATWTAKLIFHVRMDGNPSLSDYVAPARHPKLRFPQPSTFLLGSLCKNFGCYRKFTQNVCLLMHAILSVYNNLHPYIGLVQPLLQPPSSDLSGGEYAIRQPGAFKHLPWALP